MKTIVSIALFSLIVSISGCTTLCKPFCKDTICTTPKSAKFDTTAFKYHDDINISYWVDKIDENTTIVVQKSDDFYDTIEEVKTLKADYNLLLNSINKFNNDLNTIELGK
jgi:hypothetical protein